MTGFSPLDTQEDKIQEERNRIMNTLGIINNGPINLEESNPIGTQNKQITTNNQTMTFDDSNMNHQTAEVNNMQTPTSQNMSTEHLELLNEFSKFTKEVKMCIQAFNQNIYELQQEVTSLKSEKKIIQEQVQNSQNQNIKSQHIESQQNQQQVQQNMNVQGNLASQMPINNPNNNFTQHSSNSFTSSHQERVEQPVRNQIATGSSHPRTGSFVPNDVKIEDIFYCGNK